MRTKQICLPIGQKDWLFGGTKCDRIRFFIRQEDRLRNLGYQPCFGFRGGISLTNWAGELARLAQDKGWGIYWHAPADAMYGIGRSGQLNDGQREIGEIAGEFKARFGLQYLLVHPDCANFEGYGPESGLERYNSVHSAAEMLRFFYNHVEPLRDLNDQCGNILLLENVHRIVFGERDPAHFYTYEGEHIGGLETPYLAEMVSCATCIDSEHFFGNDNEGTEVVDEAPANRAEEEWMNLSGYIVRPGERPRKIVNPSFSDFLLVMEPHILHLGGSTKLMEGDLATSHLDFNLHLRAHRDLLCLQIAYVEENGGILESEVCADDGSGWSVRRRFSGKPHHNDWLYKRAATLKIIEGIERCQLESIFSPAG